MNHYEALGPESRSLAVHDFLNNPAALRHTLEAAGALQFTPYESGLFPASDLPPETGEATGMNMAWLRDNAHVANALAETGHREQAAAVGHAMLTILHNNRGLLDDVVSGKNPASRLPVRVEGNTLQNDTEPRVQNDSVGYALWLTSKLIRRDIVWPTRHDLDNLAQTARYLEKVEFWHAEDEGHWEEDRRIHASSIGAAMAGLRELQAMFAERGYSHHIDLDSLWRTGETALQAILDQGRSDLSSRSLADDANIQPYPNTVNADELVTQHFKHFSVRRRQYDAALLFLVEPLNILSPVYQEKVVHDITHYLQRGRGIARYQGDTYWEPRFPSVMSVEERTRQAEGRTEQRNQTASGVAYTATEAQWTLFDPLLSAYWGNRYEATGGASDREKQLHYLDRSLAQLTLTDSGKLQLPEAYYYEYVPTLAKQAGNNHWIPNAHTPLLWSQANLLLALKAFEETTQ